MNGRSYADEREHNDLVKLTIETRVPSKWRMVDLEHGEIWMWKHGKWVRADDLVINDLTDHVIEKQIKPAVLAEKLADEGIDVDVVLVNTGPVDDEEGWTEVECVDCGRRANVPTALFTPGQLALCPNCMNLGRVE